MERNENRGARKGGARSKKKRKEGELNFSPKPKRIEFSVSKFLIHHTESEKGTFYHPTTYHLTYHLTIVLGYD